MSKEEFLKDVANWDNHRMLLWPALESTIGDVIEMGMGHGSTPYLHQYCADTSRRLFSYDNTLEWASKFEEYKTKDHSIEWVSDWDKVFSKCDVLLVDHAPGERRHIDIARFKDIAKILVIHDSESAATGYMLDKIWHLFKYRIDYKTEGAWASAVSNSIDVSTWIV